MTASSPHPTRAPSPETDNRLSCTSCGMAPLLPDEEAARLCDECGAYRVVHGVLPDRAWVQERLRRAHGSISRAPSPAAVVSDDMLVGERVHPLKTWPRYFAALLDGSKTFEARTNDRDYRVGDVLHLREWDSIDGYSGRELWFRATYVLTGGEVLGLPDHIAILGLRPFSASRAAVEVGEDAGWMVIHRVDSGPYKLYMGTRDEMLVLYERLATQWTQVILVRVMVPDANSVECGEARRLFNNLVRSPHPTDVMVERAAEAIWDAFMVNVAWDLGDSIAHDSYRDLARAALSAALTPLGETK